MQFQIIRLILQDKIIISSNFATFCFDIHIITKTNISINVIIFRNAFQFKIIIYEAFKTFRKFSVKKNSKNAWIIPNIGVFYTDRAINNLRIKKIQMKKLSFFLILIIFSSFQFFSFKLYVSREKKRRYKFFIENFLISFEILSF